MSSRQPLRSRKEDLIEIVGLYRCDRCFRKHKIEELVEDESMPGLLVCPGCFEKVGFDVEVAENPRDNVQHYFRSSVINSSPYLLDEDGNPILDEEGNPILAES